MVSRRVQQLKRLSSLGSPLKTNWLILLIYAICMPLLDAYLVVERRF